MDEIDHDPVRGVDGFAGLLDAWDAPQGVLIGHSYGAELASRFCLAQPGRAAAVLLMCGPYVGDWRTRYGAERDRRTSAGQRERRLEPKGVPYRTEEQEAELLTLSWFTDHADPEREWHWAAQAARRRRPVNWAMNAELGAEARAAPLDERLYELRAALPARAEMLGGDRDPRPVSALAALALRLGLPLTCIGGAGHEPWLERPDAVRTHLRRFVDRVGE